MAGHLLSAARKAARRLAARTERALFPEAEGPRQQWQRVVLDRSVDSYLQALGVSALSGAEISGEGHAGRPWREFTSLNYPDFDLCAPLETDRRFDVVICEQVLEHVADPVAAAANLRGLAEPGGHVIVSTPFLIRVHELPAYGMRDLWRFTPGGLQLLLEGAGLEVDAVRSWGNRQCVVGNLSRWAAFRPRLHSLRDSPDIPVQVWAFARNPEEPR